MGQNALVCDELLGDRFSAKADCETSLQQRVADYDDLLALLSCAQGVGGFWGGEEHVNIWAQCIEDITNVYEDNKDRSGRNQLLELRMYASLFLLYSAGLGAFANNRFATLHVLLQGMERFRLERRQSLATEAFKWKTDARQLWNEGVLGGVDRFTPVSEHLENSTFRTLRGIVSLHQTRFVTTFDRFEYFVGLVQCFGTGSEESLQYPRCPMGSFLWRCRLSEDDPGAFFLTDAATKGEKWPPFQAGLFKGEYAVLAEVIRTYEHHANLRRGHLHM